MTQLLAEPLDGLGGHGHVVSQEERHELQPDLAELPRAANTEPTLVHSEQALNYTGFIEIISKHIYFHFCTTLVHSEQALNYTGFIEIISLNTSISISAQL